MASISGDPAQPASNVQYTKYITLAVVIALICAAIWAKDYVRSLNSLRRVPGTNAYVMDYYGDYHLEEIRQHGMDVRRIEYSCIRTLFPDFVVPLIENWRPAFLPSRVRTTGERGHHCSTVAMKSANGNVYFGRNFDWHHDACLILRVHDDQGVASLALLDLAYLNLNRADLDKTSLIERLPLLFAPYYLMDGMNRHGVAVSGMSVSADPPRTRGKPDIIDATLMRLILDYATTADEAVEMIHDYNVHFVDTEGHLMVTDAAGRSRIVESIGGKIRVVASDGPWQVCTNHIAWNRSERARDLRCPRYRIGSQLAEQLAASADSDDALRVARSMQQGNFTMWTSLYNLTTGEVRVFHRSNRRIEYRDALRPHDEPQ